MDSRFLSERYGVSQMKKLTVFTPTYNRAYCLNICYESLKRQTCKDFVWLIIDDGSSDDTKKLVDNWTAENIIEVKYQFQKNQGMHGAHNTAYNLIETELNVCIDSDDFMPDDAVEKILSYWEQNKSEELAGIAGLDANENGVIIGTKFPNEITHSTLFDIYHKFGVKGDKKLVYRSELTKNFPYPVIEGERYIGLNYKYYKIDLTHKLVLLNEVLCYVEYMEDGSSRNMLKQYRKNSKGFAFYRKENMKNPYASLKFKFKECIHYVSSSLISKNWKFIKESPCKLLTIIAIPAGFILYSYIVRNTCDSNF